MHPSRAGAAIAVEGDPCPDQLDDSEGPGADPEPVGASEHAATCEGEDEAATATFGAYISIMNVSAATPNSDSMSAV
jgi:hypothetical protein